MFQVPEELDFIKDSKLKPHSLVRRARQISDSSGRPVCDFGAAHDVTWCSWHSPGTSALSR